MISSWVFFPLVLAAIGLGWGALIQWLAGERELGALTIPLGLASAIVVAGLLTAFSSTAPLAAPVASIGAIAGVGYVWGRARIGAAPALAAIGVLLVFGAPVILSGTATFLGYVRLDDTSTWLGLTDQLFAHGRSFTSLQPDSTFRLIVETNLGTGHYEQGTVAGASYPAGSFMLLGIGHWVTGIDSAWIFQPYLACCAAALALAVYELLTPIVTMRWLRGVVAFLGAQSALLFGYAAWGGIKELTVAFLIPTAIAAIARLLAHEQPRARSALPLALVVAALMLSLGPGGSVYVLPALLALVAGLLWRGVLGVHPARLAWVFLAFAAASALFLLPFWLTLASYLRVDQGSFTSINSHAAEYGNLLEPLRAIQLAGIWFYSDFRKYSAAMPFGATPSFLNYALIWLVFASGLGALAWSAWKRQGALAAYMYAAMIGVLAVLAEHGTPWLTGKALAMSSPAILLGGLVGAAVLIGSRRAVTVIAGVAILGALGVGVIYSNVLQYRNVSLAPRDQLAELQTIGQKLAGEGPTFVNEYEIYADRHFLRAGAPVAPSEYRPGPQELLPTTTGAVLTAGSFADIDSFPLSTLQPFRSLVTRVSPVASRPPSDYHLVWEGRFYQLWRQATHLGYRIIKHVPLGDSTTLNYCGPAENGADQPLCSIQPAAVMPCPQVLSLAQEADGVGGYLVAHELTNPIVLRGTQTTWPSSWIAGAGGLQALTPTTPGTDVARIEIPTGPHSYQLWLGGSFARGFVVSVDGRRIGAVSNELNNTGDYNSVGAPLTLGAGVHVIDITYPKPGWGPGGDDDENYTSLFEVVLQQLDTPSSLLRVEPSQASTLCGRSLDWVEVVQPTSG